MSAVQRVWDINGTAFNSWNFLRDLIATASKDDVQPGAILAAEAIGTHMIMYDERIVQANVALEADTSQRLLQTRLSIGLHYGNTLRALQTSTPLKKFFIFVSGLKLRYADADIANILYLIVKERGLREEHPLSPMQFEQLLKQIGGHARNFAPTQLLHNIRQNAAKYGPFSISNWRVDYEELAKLFSAVFDALLNTSTSSVSISGSRSGLWIATAIHWWLEDQSCIVVNDEILAGQYDAKIKIVILTDSNDPWTVNIWTSINNPTKLICVADSSEGNDIHVPRRNMKDLASRLQTFCLKAIPQSKTYDNQYSHFWLELTTQVAASLILLVHQHGKLLSKGENRQTVMLADVVGPEWITTLDAILAGYGLCQYNGNKELLDQLNRVLARHRNGPSHELSMAPAPDALSSVCDQFINTSMQDTQYSCEVLQPACHIALDAIMTCTTRTNAEVVRIVSDEGMLSTKQSLNHLITFIHSGFIIEEFICLAFERLLLTDVERSRRTVALASDGYYAMLNVIKSPSCDPAKVLDIGYGYGTIKHEGILFSAVHDRSSATIHANINEYGSRIDPSELLEKAIGGIAIHSPYKFNSIRIETQISVSSMVLLLQQFILTSDKGTTGQLKYSISWFDICVGCALAWNKRTPTTAEQHNALAKDLKYRDEIYWSHPFSQAIKNKSVTLVDTRSSEILKMFSVGWYNSREHFPRSLKMFVHSNASGSLLPVLSAAAGVDTCIVFL